MDSIRTASQAKPKVDTSGKNRDTANLNNPQVTTVASQLQKATTGTEQTAELENDLIKVSFTNKGGQIKAGRIKKI